MFVDFLCKTVPVSTNWVEFPLLYSEGSTSLDNYIYSVVIDDEDKDVNINKTNQLWIEVCNICMEIYKIYIWQCMCGYVYTDMKGCWKDLGLTKIDFKS